MLRPLATGLALSLLAGCGSGGNQGGEILKAALAQIWSGEEAQAEGQPAAPARLTRAQAEAAGVALVRLRSLDQAGRSTFGAQSDNEGYVSYVSRFGQLITLKGSLITGSRGIGTDLLSLATDPADPVVTPTALADWPESVTRTYRFPAVRGPAGDALRVTCRFVPDQDREMEILEVVFQGRQIEEICSDGAGTEFTNTHFTDLDTGRVWRSVQWLGPVQGFVDLEVIVPHPVLK